VSSSSSSSSISSSFGDHLVGFDIIVVCDVADRRRMRGRRGDLTDALTLGRRDATQVV